MACTFTQRVEVSRHAPECHSGALKFKPGAFRLENYWISQPGGASKLATFATVIR